MNIFFVGIYGLGARALEELLQRGFHVTGLLTKPDRGDGQRALLELAARERVPLFQPESPSERGLMARVRALKPDLLVVAGYHRRIPSSLIRLAPLGALNTHLSLLPQYRGPCPWKWAILQGEHSTGVTVHAMTASFDQGPILAQRSCPIAEEDTGETLFRRLSELGAITLAETLRAVEGGVASLMEQDEAGASYFSNPTEQDAKIRWYRPAREIRNLVRGLHPRPGAWTVLGEQRLRVDRATAYEDIIPDAPPGTVIDLADGVPTVVTGHGIVTLDEFRAIDAPANMHHFPGSVGSVLSA